MMQTTTIRVSTQTRDRLNVLARRRRASASQLVAELVRAADDDALLAEAEKAFKNLGRDQKALAAYQAETCEIEAFEAPMPEW